MNLAAQFATYLKENNLSRVSIKNYLSDINKFLAFCPKEIPEPVDFANWSQYLVTNSTPPKTAKRYLSSLRKFGQFLEDKQILAQNPSFSLDHLNQQLSVEEKNNTQNMITQYQKALEKQGMSPVTIKNYLADTKQFLDWLAIRGRDVACNVSTQD